MKSGKIAPQVDEDAQPESEAIAMVDARYRPVFKTVLRERSHGARLLAIRAAAGIPLDGKRQIRNAIDSVSENGVSSRHTSQTNWLRSTSSCCSDGWGRISIWQKTLKTLEGMYGSGVLSFFVFLKSLFTLNAILTLIVVAFVVGPQAANWRQSSTVLAGLQASASTNVTGNCSAAYTTSLTAAAANSTVVTKLLDAIQGTGALENTILFLGYYFPTSVTLGSLAYHIPVAYLVVVGVAFFISLIFMLDRTGSAFKEVLLQRGSSAASESKFSAMALSGWDHGLAEAQAVDLARRILRNSFIAELDLHELMQRRLTGGACGDCRLWMKRILVNLIVLGSLGGGGYLIYWVQTLSAEFATNNAAQSGSLVYFVYQFMPSVVLSLLTGLLPVVYYLLVQLEEYTPDRALAVTLGRCIFLRLAGLAVLVASIYSTITCRNKDLCGVGIAPTCTAVTCWETYVGQAFYKLEVTFLASHLIVCFLVELPRSLISRKCRCGLAKLIGPPEFDIADSVLQVLYSQVLVWFGMLFCPLLPAMNAVVLLALFYLRKFSCHFSYQPPERPLKNSSATAMFMVTLFVVYFLCVIPIGYLIVSLPTSKSCSPFRTGGVAYDSISGLVSGFGSDARHLLGYLGSAAFLFVVAIALLIVIHYYRTLALAWKEIGDQRLKQLTEQEQLKFSLLSSSNSEAGLTDKKPPTSAGAVAQSTTPV